MTVCVLQALIKVLWFIHLSLPNGTFAEAYNNYNKWAINDIDNSANLNCYFATPCFYIELTRSK